MNSAVIDERPVLPALPFHREAGSGPAVVCIHCNASSSSQWRPLMDRLAPRHRVLAPDTHGAGRGPAWPTERTLTLHDEVALLEPVFARAGAPFALVGHSYGAAVALLAALKQPERVHALVLYEPTLFALVDAASPAPNAADGIRETVARAVAALAAGDRSAAAEAFIDYWMGTGAWAAKPESQRSAIEAAIVNVQGWGRALLGETTPLTALRDLEMPVLLMQGSETPPSARAVATLLARTLPRVETLSFEGLGHMGPITHPALVDAAIDSFLRRHSAP
jgi:pimeloyl-ACP methyl ester carboxylesterase